MSDESRERNVETLAQFLGGIAVFLVGIAIVITTAIGLIILWR